MTYKADLMALVLPLFNGKAWYDTTPENFAYGPGDVWLVMQQVGEIDQWYVDNTLPDHSHARVRFFVWSERRELTDAKSAELRRALAAQTIFTSVRPEGGATDETSPGLNLRGSRREFNVWYLDPAP